MDGGIVARRRVGQKIIFTFEEEVIAVLELVEAGDGKAAFSLQLVPLNLDVGIGVAPLGSTVAVQVLAPLKVGVFREEFLARQHQGQVA